MLSVSCFGYACADDDRSCTRRGGNNFMHYLEKTGRNGNGDGQKK